MNTLAQKSKPFTWLVLCTFAWCWIVYPVPVFSQEQGLDYLKRAQQKFDDDWDINGAIADVTRALSIGLKTDAQKIQAFQLLGFCYAENGENIKSIEAFKNLLKTNPGYMLNADVSPTYQIPFYTAKQEFYAGLSKPKSKNYLLWIGITGAAVISTVVILSLQKDDPGPEEEPGNGLTKLIDPPEMPGE